jgi:hypothetical protein
MNPFPCETNTPTEGIQLAATTRATISRFQRGRKKQNWPGSRSGLVALQRKPPVDAGFPIRSGDRSASHVSVNFSHSSRPFIRSKPVRLRARNASITNLRQTLPEHHRDGFEDVLHQFQSDIQIDFSWRPITSVWMKPGDINLRVWEGGVNQSDVLFSFKSDATRRYFGSSEKRA